MFRKTDTAVAVAKPANKKDLIPTIIGKDVNILGNIVSEGNVDFNGTLDGNIRCESLTLREDSSVKGEIVATTVFAARTSNSICLSVRFRILTDASSSR